LVSDRTPWRGGETDALEVLTLDERDAWRDAIERWATLNTRDRQSRRADALAFARDYMENRAGVKECRVFFLNAMGLPADLWTAPRPQTAKPVAAPRPTRSLSKNSSLAPAKPAQPEARPLPALTKRSVA
jgi:hypothetical protein